MVTKPNTSIPPAPTGLQPNPTKIEPATVVTGKPALNLPDGKDVANKDRTGDNKFKLPDSVPASQIRDESFRYGGGRSAGNRSLADNKGKQEMEQ